MRDHPWNRRLDFIPKIRRADGLVNQRVWLRMSGRYPMFTIRVGDTRTYRRFVVIAVGALDRTEQS